MPQYVVADSRQGKTPLEGLKAGKFEGCTAAQPWSAGELAGVKKQNVNAEARAKMEALKEHSSAQELAMIVAICMFLCVAVLVVSLLGRPKTSR